MSRGLSKAVKVCLEAREWHQLHEQMEAISQRNKLSAPPVPLILAGWMFSSTRQKNKRWLDTIDWLNANGLYHLLENFTEDQYFFVRQLDDDIYGLDEETEE